MKTIYTGTFADPLALRLAAAAGRIVPGMDEATAERIATAAAFDGEEDPEGYLDLLAAEAEAREEHRLYCLYGPYDGL